MIAVHLHQIPPGETLSVMGEITGKELAVFGVEEAGAEPVDALRYALEIGVSGGGLFATGSWSLPIKVTCVSCLEPFEYEISSNEFALQKELTGAELVDLTDEIREDIHLVLPMHPKCALGGKKCPAQFPQRVVPSSTNSEVRSVWAALDQFNPS
ncbi:MAG: DUF177 domain-containing protein [Verrucomicrobia bacterium]|nr:DUF177 domain-containing protein [Verrucomicrobiota bacterium]